MGNVVVATPFRNILTAAPNQNQAMPWIGKPFASWKYSGAQIDFALTATGDATAVSFGTVPTDAVGVELWVNANGSTDYLFTSTQAGRLSGTGVIGTNITANLAATRYVANGDHIIMPFLTVGAAPASFRVACGVSGARCQGRFISQAAGYPYMLGTTTEWVLTGAGASQQLPYGSTGSFPVGNIGALMQLVGSGVARYTIDGTVPSATYGDILVPGTYYIDIAAHGIALSALRVFLPTGTNLIGSSLMSA